ncbi:MAG: hypothetical protein GX595_17050 [Lentisphaerae bacterium]|nr:hypothetical protein [Lentisphaerota bacterium]
MDKATWYYARGRAAQAASDVEDLVQSGVRSVLFNSPDEASAAPFLEAAGGQPLELHIGISLKELHERALGCPPPPMVIPDRDAFVARFGDRCLSTLVCWSGLTQGAALAAWLVRHCREAGYAKGVSLDVLRYPNTVFAEDFPCACESCQARRRPWLGHGCLEAADRTDPSVMYKELETKGAVIGGVARDLAQALHAAGLEFSLAARAVYAGRDHEHAAAPMWGYGPALYEGQDWAAWCRDGLLDTVHFMNYTPRLERLERLTRQHRDLLRGAPVRHHEGLGVTCSAGRLSPADLDDQIRLCADLGAAGVTLFPWHGVSAEHRAVLARW